MTTGQVLPTTGQLTSEGASRSPSRTIGWLAIMAGMAWIWLTNSTSAVAQSDTPAASHAEHESIQWTFEREDDQDYDGQLDSDRWQRRQGVRFPKYVEATCQPKEAHRKLALQLNAIDGDNLERWNWLKPLRKRSRWKDVVSLAWPVVPMSQWGAALRAMEWLPDLPPSMVDALVDKYLKIEINGGQYQLESLPVPTSRLYQYQLRCDVMTHGIRRDVAVFELVFLSDSGEEIIAHTSPEFTLSTPWTTHRLPRVRPPMGAKSMKVRLMVLGSANGLEDYSGTVGFDNVRIDRFPQLNITSDVATGVYQVGQPITILAKALGLSVDRSQVLFSLFDCNGRRIQSKQIPIVGSGEAVTAGVPSSDASWQRGATDSLSADLQWRLGEVPPGFYQISASIVNPSGRPLTAETTFAVVDPTISQTVGGPFGWTIPASSQYGPIGSLSSRELARWVAMLGASWVKYPCWVAGDDTEAINKIVDRVEKFHQAGVQVVGMLDQPPPERLEQFELRGRNDILAASLFRDQQVWQRELDPVMSQLTLKIHKWQLGADRDHSFLGRSRLKELVEQISKGLQGFGQPIDVAISWPWIEKELPPAESAWHAVCRSSDPGLGADELNAHLALAKSKPRSAVAPETWLLVDPVDRQEYSRDQRIQDLVLRMATIRRHRVEAAFVSDPLDSQRGLLRKDGRPDELLLPWRTTAAMLGRLRDVGSVDLRSGADNRVFVGGDEAVWMLWSAEPTEERLYLGEDVYQVDVWGRTKPLPIISDSLQPYHQVKIGPLPTFIRGVDPVVLAFRMSVDVEPTRFDSLLGERQRLSVSFTNPTPHPLGGTVRVTAPSTWQMDNPRHTWEAGGGDSLTEDYEVILSNNAKVGQYEIPIQFELDTVPPKLFTVHRKMSVGPEGVKVKVMTRMMPNGQLRVQIEVSNESNRQQAYEARLFVQGRTYKSTFFLVKPRSTIRREIYWENGEQLIGKMMTLRADEQDGSRIMNYVLKVTR